MRGCSETYERERLHNSLLSRPNAFSKPELRLWSSKLPAVSCLISFFSEAINPSDRSCVCCSSPRNCQKSTYQKIKENWQRGLVTLVDRVLRPPGGGSNFSLGFDEPKEQPMRKNKMASSIFGTPEENPPSWAKSSGTKPGEIREDTEPSGPQRNSTDANCGDVDPKGGDGGGETFENIEADVEAAPGQNEEKSLPAAPVPSPVAPAPAPSRRNPPGGKSSLVLG
uniref:Jupiter microtubule associated homolog 1 n=1 Tax=Meleagris gallopavo TaxID=9103 RepID=A0A803XYF4_MELGA